MIWNEAGAEFHIISLRGINCDIEQVTVLNNRFIAERPLTLVREAQPLYYARMYMRVWKMRRPPTLIC